MNKYALIISATVAFAGISGLFSEDKLNEASNLQESRLKEESNVNAGAKFGVLGSIGKFGDDVLKEHPKKLVSAGLLSIYQYVTDGYTADRYAKKLLSRYQINAFVKPKVRTLLAGSDGFNIPFRLPTVPLCIVTYATGKTLYDRSKKQ